MIIQTIPLGSMGNIKSMKNLNTRHYCVLICVVLFTILLLGCSQKDPETHVNIRIRNLSDYHLEEINLGHGRQNGATSSTSYLRRNKRHSLSPQDYTEYKAMLPNTANYRAIEIRAEGYPSQTVYFTGHKSLVNSNLPVTRDPLEAGKYYTFEFDLDDNDGRENDLEVIYFNIVEDQPPAEN